MRSKGFCFLFILISLISAPLHAQEAQAAKPLEEVLAEVQVRFEVQFNYAYEIIETIEVLPPESDLELSDILTYLEDQTGLQFRPISDNIIAILPPSSRLCGYLVHSETGESIPFATVVAAQKSTVTDANGFFDLNVVPDEAMLRIQHLGYVTIEEKASNYKGEDCVRIALIPQKQQLAEVVVYDYLITGIDKLEDGSFSIDFDRFSILPGLIENDVLQSVQAFPGITSINETVSNINIRGGSNDQNLILWDGIKMYQNGHFFGLISLFNPQITQQVSLRKNGSPSFLTDGVSGTITMETNKSLNPTIRGNVGINFIDASGFADVPLGKKSSLQLAARKSINDLLETPTYTEYFNRVSQDTEIADNNPEVVNSNIDFDFYDTSLRWLWKPTDKDELQLNFIYAQNGLEFDESASLNQEIETRQSSLDQNSIAAGFRYSRRWSERWGTLLNVYNTDYKLQAINANILSDQRFLQENKVSETSVLIQGEYQPGGNLSWTNGYQFIETKVSNLDDVDDPVFRRLRAEVLRIHSVFTAAGWRSDDKRSNLNMGVRFNYLEKFSKGILEPRLSFNQRMGEKWSLEVLGEFKNQNTSQVINFQNDFLGLERRRWQLSNNDSIPIIRNRQISAGISFTDKGWLVNAVGYYKKVNGITTRSQGFLNQYEFVSENGSYDAKGVDLLLRKQFDKLNSWVSYSFLDSNYRFPGLPEQNFASNYDITHSVTLGTTYSYKGLDLSAGLNWRSGKPYTEPDPEDPISGNDINYLPTNSSRLDDYLRIDLSGLYSFQTGRKTSIQVGGSVWNLTNRENIINAFFRIDESGVIERSVQTSLGITPNAVLRFYF